MAFKFIFTSNQSDVTWLLPMEMETSGGYLDVKRNCGSFRSVCVSVRTRDPRSHVRTVVEKWCQIVSSSNGKLDYVNVFVLTGVSFFINRAVRNSETKCHQMNRWRFSWGTFSKIQFHCGFDQVRMLCLFRCCIKSVCFSCPPSFNCWCGCKGVHLVTSVDPCRADDSTALLIVDAPQHPSLGF